MNYLKRFLLLTVGTCVMAATSANGDIIRELENGDLLVIDFKGKPPHERRIISRESAEFARFEEQADQVSVLTTSVRRGPPGKGLPSQRSRVIQVDADQITEFARFEESGGSSENGRMWRGAPGKGIPRLNR